MPIYLLINEPVTGFVDRTGKLAGGEKAGSIGFTLTLNQRGQATLPLELAFDDTYRPRVGWPVYLYDIDWDAEAPDMTPRPRTYAAFTGDGSTHAIGSGIALWIQIAAPSTNSATARAGGFTTSATAGTPIEPGGSFFFPIVSASTYDLSAVYYWVQSGDVLNVTYLSVSSALCVFAGTIDSIETKWTGNRGQRLATLNCVSFEQVFDTLKIDPIAFFDMSCGDIIRYLLYEVCAGVPVIGGAIEDGPNIPSLVCDYHRVSDIFNQLATTASTAADPFVWGVDPATSSLYFGPQSTTPAPMTLVSSLVLWETWTHKETRSDYRNREIVRLSQSAFNATVFEAVGDGSTTTFDLPAIAKAVTLATIGGSGAVAASQTGTFTGQPVSSFPTVFDPHGTITIGAAVYYFVNSFGEAQVPAGRSGTFVAPNQVLIGATAAATFQNLVDCINGNPDQLNVTYAYSTGGDPQVTAGVAGTTLTVTAKASGTTGNGIAVTTTDTNFSWTASPLAGGTDPSSSTGLNVGTEGDGAIHDFYYTVGKTRVRTATAVPLGETLAVTFYAVGRDCIVAQNTAEIAARAAAEHSHGKYDHEIDDSSNGDRNAGLAEATTALATYDNIPQIWSIETDQHGFLPGMEVTAVATKPDNISGYVNGTNWKIQDISARIEPGMDQVRTAPGGHFRYTLTLMSDIHPSYMGFWENLA